MPDIDSPLSLALGLAWGTLGLVALMVLSLLLLRARHWHRAPRLAAFEAQCLPRLMACALGETVAVQPLAPWQRWPFMRTWLHAQMSLRGASRQRLAAWGRAMGCGPMALQRAHSRHASDRLVGTLALGFLGETTHAPLLLQRVREGGAHQTVYAARALMEIDPHSHAHAVVQALVHSPELDLPLASVMLKPVRSALATALLSAPPSAQDPWALRWLQLARALRLQVNSEALAPFLQQNPNTENLMAAIRLVHDAPGLALLMPHVTHADWRVRAQAARALGTIGQADTHAVLTPLLTDAQWWVRYRAAQALLRLPGMDAERLLAHARATQDRYALSMAQAVVAEHPGKA